MDGSGAGVPIRTDLVPACADPIDPLSGLPLVICDKCNDIRVIALTCVNTTNKGKRFFKCPRNKEKDPSSCRFYYFQDDYEAYLRKKGKLIDAPGGTNEASSSSAMEPGVTVGAAVGVDDQIKALKEQIEGIRTLVDAFGRRDVLLAGIIAFGVVLIFLVASSVFLLGVIIYIMMAN